VSARALDYPRPGAQAGAWTRIRPLHFFRVVSLHSGYLLVGLALMGIAGVVTLALDRARAIDALTPVLVLQMFAVSSGFQVPARRGHFDLLLTGGSTRIRIALAHWALSALPGLVVWIVIGLAELVISQGAYARAFHTGSITAFLVVSTIGWALTVPLPRLTGGVLWVVTMVVAVTITSGSREALIAAARHDGTVVSRAFLWVVFPFSLIGTRIGLADLPSVAPVLVTACAVWSGAIWWIARTDIPLEAAQ
jgi:hypothetical protein